MLFDDLWHFITTLEQMNELKVISGASLDLEIGAITEVASFRNKFPAVLFESIPGVQKNYRVLTNFLANQTRERLV